MRDRVQIMCFLIYFITIIVISYNITITSGQNSWSTFRHDYSRSQITEFSSDFNVSSYNASWICDTSEDPIHDKGENYCYSSPALADIDDDGILEVIFGTDFDYTFAVKPYEGVVWSSNTQGRMGGTASIDVLTDDKRLLTVIGSDPGIGGNLYVLDARTGVILIDIDEGRDTVALADLNSDGNKDIIAPMDLTVEEQTGIIAYTVIGTFPAYSVQELWRYEIHADNVHIPIIGDVNLDGINDIIFSDNHYIYAVDNNGELIWKSDYLLPINLGEVGRLYELSYWERDGEVYIFTSSSSHVGEDENITFTSPLICLDGDGNERWRYLTNKIVRCPPVVVNKKDETYFIIPSGKWIYAIDANGSIKYETNLYDPFNLQFSDNGPMSMAAADFNSDGYIEVILFSASGVVFGVREDGKIIWVNRLIDMSFSAVSPAIADIDGDGTAEIVMTIDWSSDTNTQRLVVFDPFPDYAYALRKVHTIGDEKFGSLNISATITNVGLSFSNSTEATFIFYQEINNVFIPVGNETFNIPPLDTGDTYIIESRTYTWQESYQFVLLLDSQNDINEGNEINNRWKKTVGLDDDPNDLEPNPDENENENNNSLFPGFEAVFVIGSILIVVIWRWTNAT